MREVLRALLCTGVSAAGAAAWTRLVALLRRRRRLSAHHARKLMHVGTAPLFLLTCALYPPHALSPLLAATVPLSFALSIARDPDASTLVAAVARSSDARHDAAATASYALATAVVTAVGWRSAPTYVAVAALCFGDGLAGLVGPAVRSPSLPHAPAKTVAGSLSCFVATLLSSALILTVAPIRAPRAAVLVLAAAAATFVETLPIQDNLTVPFTAFAVTKLCS